MAKPRISRLVSVADNDSLSKAFDGLVPERFVDTDSFLNVVQWNIEWFGAAKSRAKDKTRRKLVLDVLEAFNADLFVFQEVAGPSKDGRYEGVLDSIATELTKRGAGDYVVYYSDAGGEQRVAMMWDRDFVRAKAPTEDLFAGERHLVGSKDAFAGRRPLHGYFEAKGTSGSRFDFQTVGVHLKAMDTGAEQRKKSAEVLAKWLQDARETVDADILVIGDWNAPPDAAEWKPIRDIAGVKFDEINDPSDFSYLWLKNSTDKFVSRIDLTAMSLASETPPPAVAGGVVKWRPIAEALARSGSLTDSGTKKVLREIKETLSDHLPTVTQFYLEPPQSRIRPRKG